MNTTKIIENYISQKCPFTGSLVSKNIHLSTSRVNSSSSQFKNNTTISSFVSRKRVKAELLLKKCRERFKRKSQLFEKQESLEINLQRDNVTEVKNQSKLLELKNDYNLDKDKSFSDVNIYLFVQVKQRTS